MPKYYAGIGSRETPADVLDLMTSIAVRLDKSGYILRSGGADGADSAFEAGATNKEIYLPWKSFNGKNGIVCGDDENLREIARKYHPVWNHLSRGAMALHTRNVAQIMGVDLSKNVEFVICWTKGARGGGGTGQAIRIAISYGIPVHDLADSATRAKFEK